MQPVTVAVIDSDAIFDTLPNVAFAVQNTGITDYYFNEKRLFNEPNSPNSPHPLVADILRIDSLIDHANKFEKLGLNATVMIPGVSQELIQEFAELGDKLYKNPTFPREIHGGGVSLDQQQKNWFNANRDDPILREMLALQKAIRLKQDAEQAKEDKGVRQFVESALSKTGKTMGSLVKIQASTSSGVSVEHERKDLTIVKVDKRLVFDLYPFISALKDHVIDNDPDALKIANCNSQIVESVKAMIGDFASVSGMLDRNKKEHTAQIQTLNDEISKIHNSLMTPAKKLEAMLDLLMQAYSSEQNYQSRSQKLGLGFLSKTTNMTYVEKMNYEPNHHHHTRLAGLTLQVAMKSVNDLSAPTKDAIKLPEKIGEIDKITCPKKDTYNKFNIKAQAPEAPTFTSGSGSS